MCLSAIYWARLRHVYYANTRTDAAKIGFDDDHIYREIPLPIDQRAIPMTRLLGDEAAAAFLEWGKQARQGAVLNPDVAGARPRTPHQPHRILAAIRRRLIMGGGQLRGTTNFHVDRAGLAVAHSATNSGRHRWMGDKVTPD